MTDDSAAQKNEMISYAQNYEDVILSRIFANESTGFYVDIGACHPIHDSVTQHFYLRGWQGINIEPQPDLFAELQSERGRDTNLNICVGSKPGKQKLYITADQGTSTLDTALASHYQSTGRVTREIDVDVVPLTDIWKQYVGTRQVDFLKIDVEGLEKEVLASADFAVVNPRILLIEAVHPDTHEPVHEEWESLIAEHYCLFYFDGLNRFYYRNDFSLDIPRCSTPPNVFDHFKTYREHLAEQASHYLTDKLEDYKTQIQGFEQLLEQKNGALLGAAEAYKQLHIQSQEQKDMALQDAADAYKELQTRFEEQLGELERLKHSKD
jgi:FkbM family methyltransferase